VTAAAFALAIPGDVSNVGETGDAGVDPVPQPQIESRQASTSGRAHPDDINFMRQP
jgi:hypothetical protein